MIHLLLAAVLLLLLPFLTGQGLMAALDDLQKKRAGLPEKYLSGSLVLLLLTEAAHLLTLIRGEGIAFCLKTAGLLWILVATVSYLFTLVRTFLRTLKSSPEPKERKKDKAPADSVTAVFGAAAFLLIAAQLVYIALGSHVAITGDMTAETVQTLLGGAPFYETNPMTGLPYRAGIPSRLKILVLPSFYAIFARAFSLPATTVVWQLMPVFWAVNGYCAFAYLGRIFFPGADADARRKRGIFLFLAAFLVLASDSLPGTEGFSLLHAGFTGVSIRLWVLVPALIAAFRERRFVLCALAVLTESVILWTRFGVGMTLLLLLSLIAATLLLRRREVQPS